MSFFRVVVVELYNISERETQNLSSLVLVPLLRNVMECGKDPKFKQVARVSQTASFQGVEVPVEPEPSLKSSRFHEMTVLH